MSSRRTFRERNVSSNTVDLTTSALLGAIHRGVRLAQQYLGRHFLVGRRRLRISVEERDPDAGGDVDLRAVDGEDILENSLDALGGFDGVRLVVEILGQDDELVAAEPSHRVVGP